jgi:hypothetical protein
MISNLRVQTLESKPSVVIWHKKVSILKLMARKTAQKVGLGQK